MKYSIFILISLLSFTFCFALQSTQKKGKRLFSDTEVSKASLLPKQAINFSISFIDKKSPINKGWWFFSQDHMEIEINLTNNSDSPFFVVPPHSSPIGGNPSFSIIDSETDSVSLIPENLTIINVVPKMFIKMEPNAVYRDTLDILEDNSYNFKLGKKYKIKAIYFSRWASFKDEMDSMQKIWSGTVDSNILEFIYPE